MNTLLFAQTKNTTRSGRTATTRQGFAKMGNQPATPVTEPIGRRVGNTVRRFRHDRGLDLHELEARLAEEGHPIKLGQLSKLERGERRVDVDDLVALAVVLNVTPNQLLMPDPPPEGEDQVVTLTPHRAVGWHRAWQWMCGDHWLADDMRPPTDEDEAEWHLSARPHDPFGGYQFSPTYLFGREDDVHAVIEAVKEALKPKQGKKTLRRRWVINAIDWYLAVETGESAVREGPTRG
jgi:transcriptional regulator with XRE-family HTH domain